MFRISRVLPLIASTLTVGVANANSSLSDFVNSQLASILDSDIVVSSIIEQNHANSGLTQSDIDALDLQWRAEADGADGSMIDNSLSNSLSRYLLEATEESDGLVTEIFIMDNHGLNVGQSGLTSDYWQGDEAKWQQTFLVGKNATHASDIEFDESSQTYQLQVSVSIFDNSTNEVGGAATFGVAAEVLEMYSLEEGY